MRLAWNFYLYVWLSHLIAVSLREKTVVREQRKRKPCHAVGSSARGKSDELTLAVGDGDGDGDGFLGK